MSKKRRRTKRPPKGNYHATGNRQPLNRTGKVDVADEIDRLRRQAKKAGVEEMLAPDEEAFSTMPHFNIVAARHVLAGIRMGAMPVIDPAAVFDLVHLSMAAHFGVELADREYVPTGHRLEWLLDLAKRCGLDAEATADGRLVYAPSTQRFGQYQKISMIAVKRISLIGR